MNTVNGTFLYSHFGNSEYWDNLRVAQTTALLTKRSLTITVAALSGEQIRVDVHPAFAPRICDVNEQIKYSHQQQGRCYSGNVRQSPYYTDLIDSSREN